MARQRNPNPDDPPPLTEADWLAATTPHDLLHHIRESASHRRLRLFACACCRPLVGKVKGANGKAKLAAAERYAEGLISDDEFSAVFSRPGPRLGRVGDVTKLVRFAFHSLGWPDREEIREARDGTTLALKPGPWEPGEYAEECTFAVVRTVSYASVQPPFSGPVTSIDDFQLRFRGVTALYADLFREVFGNPFRPVAFHADWRTDTVVSLATAAYDSRDFSTLPILADALQDAGCDADDLLAHCRDPKQVHVRGCWAVDLVLGKG